ncbi:MAG: hypothetical protein ACK544_21950 [Microcystis sp.]|jgi:hypothetical protein
MYNPLASELNHILIHTKNLWEELHGYLLLEVQAFFAAGFWRVLSEQMID